ncbi:transposase InsO family protein [Bradyrhizobium sp. RT4b]
MSETTGARRPFESAQYTSEQFQRLRADHGIVCSMSRSGNVWDNAAMESFFS